ncbi:hypothetical protein Ddc_15910 [Ditylenchus destructor]|nr:hypothetical protein Ddc_15910 [Ditylenchus destructor]
MNDNRVKFRVLSPIRDNISTATATTMKSHSQKANMGFSRQPPAPQSRIANFQNSGFDSSQNQKRTSQKQSSSGSGERRSGVRYTKYGGICEGNIACGIEASSELFEYQSMPTTQNLDPELYQTRTKLNPEQQRVSVANKKQVTFQLTSPISHNSSIKANNLQQPECQVLYPGQSSVLQEDANTFENLPFSSSLNKPDQIQITAQKTFIKFEHLKPDLYDCKSESASLCHESSSGSSVPDAIIENSSNAIPSSSNNGVHSNSSPSKFECDIKMRLRQTRESKAEALVEMVSSLVEHKAPKSLKLDDMRRWLGFLDPQFEANIETELVTFIKNRCDSVTISLHNGTVRGFE